eukprot:TRINITY_DN12175_c7_g2_i10.p1 TRINITY_DN12175_c7_g2~~TRINITY_DN12175_c7_g2_i10.p1  ORF type:complete len:350 (+),score=44.75 TRINITY_DN12175_c7_g2_i10:58-1050(+)
MDVCLLTQPVKERHAVVAVVIGPADHCHFSSFSAICAIVVDGVSSLSQFFAGTAVNSIVSVDAGEAHINWVSWGNGATTSLTMDRHRPALGYVTCKDGTIRGWNFETRMPTFTLLGNGVDGIPMSCDIHPDTEHLAVGFSKGKLVILAPQGGHTQERLFVSEFGVSAVRFSPDGSILAVGSQEGTIRRYRRENDMYSGVVDTKAHDGAVTSLDFNEDGTILRSNSEYQVAHWLVETLEPATPRAIRAAQWTSLSTPIAWPTFGVHESLPPGDMVTASAMSDDLLVVGDTSGCLSLYHYPAGSHIAGSRVYYKHKDQIVHVGFSGYDCMHQ